MEMGGYMSRVSLLLVILCSTTWPWRVDCRTFSSESYAIGPESSPAAAPSPSELPSLESDPLVPAFFIFGDSLVDVGNNNYLGSLARANFYPNGIDFPGGNATGRFCNGRTVFDFISEFVGLPFPPPFLAPSTNGKTLLEGVNYASGAAGILDSSGSLYVQRIAMNQQLRNFETNVVQLYVMLGLEAVGRLLNEALYAVVIGSNDYINNYLQPNSPTKDSYSPEAYQQYLLTTLSAQLTAMYSLGARKVVVTNVGPLGCIPSQISEVTTDVLGRCIPEVNNLVMNYNGGLRTLLSDLNSRLPGAHFVYGDVYKTVHELVSRPQLHGFTVGNAGCCGMGRFNGQFPCLPSSHLCNTRSNYVFWDAFHPTQAANAVLAARLWHGGLRDILPVNVRDLVTHN